MATLAELPAPPPGRTGWPWTEAPSGVEPRSADGQWPTISVVTPSFNQGRFIEETIRSVLLQGYPSLEYIVMDGGSTDETVEILRRYEPWIAHWQSEKDAGQSDAVNQGWKRATGQLVTWLNSDDLLLPGWADAMARPFVTDHALDLAGCDDSVIDVESRHLWTFPGTQPDLRKMVTRFHTPFPQPGFLMHRRMLDEFGYLDRSIHFAMDAEYWIRLISGGAKATYVPKRLAAFRLHPSAKTSTLHATAIADLFTITRRFCETAPPHLRHIADEAAARVNWNAAQGCYGVGDTPAARRYALAHLKQNGLSALPRSASMVLLSVLGDPGRRVLASYRRLRYPQPTTGAQP